MVNGLLRQVPFAGEKGGNVCEVLVLFLTFPLVAPFSVQPRPAFARLAAVGIVPGDEISTSAGAVGRPASVVPYQTNPGWGGDSVGKSAFSAVSACSMVAKVEADLTTSVLHCSSYLVVDLFSVVAR